MQGSKSSGPGKRRRERRKQKKNDQRNSAPPRPPMKAKSKMADTDLIPPSDDDTLDDDGVVELPLPAYHELYDPQLLEDEPDPSPVEYAITSASYAGTVGKAGAQLTARLELEVFAEGWTQIRLFDDSLAMTDVTVENAAGKAADRHVTLVSDYRHSLLVRAAGRYVVTLTFWCDFLAESGKSGIAFSIPRAAVNRVTLAIPRLGIDVSSRPGLDEQLTQVEKPDKDSLLSDPHTRFDAVFPPTDRLQVEWTQAIEEEEAEAAAVKPLLTASVSTLASVGEGMVVCHHRVKFDIVQGQVSRFHFRLPADVNVLSVTSPAAKTWRVRPAEQINEDSDAPTVDGEGLQLGPEDVLLEVNCSYDIASAHELTIVLERKMTETSGSVRIPVIEVLGVERQRGFVGVEARTNVEVTVKEQEAVARVDIRELPSDLWGAALNPLLFGFKYLRAPWVIELDIRKHLDVEVLVATVDSCHVEATLVADGKLETRCLYFVRNNQQQYLRISLPDDSTVWSTFVSDRPVKPARDAESGHLLLSLEKSRVAADSQNAFPVEIVYLTRVPELQSGGGDLTITCPRVDVPVNHLLLRLHLPSDYRYADFRGTMKRVPVFSKPFLDKAPAVDVPMPPALMQTNMMMPQQQVMMEQSIEAETNVDILYNDEDDESIAQSPVAMKSSMFGGRSQGILPVKMTIPNIGTTQSFEQLIVLSEFATVTARYSKPRKWFFFPAD